MPGLSYKWDFNLSEINKGLNVKYMACMTESNRYFYNWFNTSKVKWSSKMIFLKLFVLFSSLISRLMDEFINPAVML